MSLINIIISLCCITCVVDSTSLETRLMSKELCLNATYVFRSSNGAAFLCANKRITALRRGFCSSVGHDIKLECLEDRFKSFLPKATTRFSRCYGISMLPPYFLLCKPVQDSCGLVCIQPQSLVGNKAAQSLPPFRLYLSVFVCISCPNDKLVMKHFG